MKIRLFSITFFLSAVLTAQNIIVDKKIKEHIGLANFQYLPKSKKMMIYNSSGDPLSQEAFYLDSDGNKTVFFEKEKRKGAPIFSRTENSYRTIDLNTDFRKRDYIFVIDGKDYTLSFDKLADINFKYFGIYNYNNVLYNDWPLESDFSGSYNDSYILGFTNPKGSWRIDFEDQDVYLEIIEIKSNSKKRVKLEKPDLTLLKGDLFAKTDFDLTFACKLTGNDSFDLITKSLSKDSQTAVLYKAEYNFEGKNVKTVPFTLNLDNKYFITSNNCGGQKYVVSTPAMQGSKGNDPYALDVMSINNYFEDRANGDLYIYGLFSDEAPKKINALTNPKGFYVFKFDKNGNKLWESVNYIDGKEYFEKVHNSAGFQLNLLEYNNDLIFSASINTFTEFTNAVVINKASGEIIKSGFVEYNNNLSHGESGRFSNSTYDSKELKNKSFSQISFAAIAINSKVMNYLKSIPDGGKRLHFETIFSDQGIWLLESDSDKYYEVIVFKD
ncbi:hypothetical protein AR687_19890 [Flavobacteriaceae bacterium CRH]|nr:hypothetical protein AR687_19890 [Flavobacteriaceae bacterium CRH]